MFTYQYTTPPPVRAVLLPATLALAAFLTPRMLPGAVLALPEGVRLPLVALTGALTLIGVLATVRASRLDYERWQDPGPRTIRLLQGAAMALPAAEIQGHLAWWGHAVPAALVLLVPTAFVVLWRDRWNLTQHSAGFTRPVFGETLILLLAALAAGLFFRQFSAPLGIAGLVLAGAAAYRAGGRHSVAVQADRGARHPWTGPESQGAEPLRPAVRPTPRRVPETPPTPKAVLVPVPRIPAPVRVAPTVSQDPAETPPPDEEGYGPFDDDSEFLAMTRETADDACGRMALAPTPPVEIRLRPFASLNHGLVGQDAALRRIEADLKRVLSGLGREPQRPLRSFLLLGPSGVGKTETAQLIAHAVYGDRTRVARFNCNESAGEGAVWRAFGAAQGYRGSEQGGVLTRQVEQLGGQCVVLLDEIEKGSKDLLDVLLTGLDTGAFQEQASHTHLALGDAVLVFTSNILAERKDLARLDEGTLREALPTAAVQTERHGRSTPFRPEFVGRIDRVVPFAALDAAALEALILQRFQNVRDRLRAHRQLEAPALTRPVLDALRQRLEQAPGGARAVKQVVEDAFYGFVTEHLTDRSVPGPHFWHSTAGDLLLRPKARLAATLNVAPSEAERCWRAAEHSGLLAVPTPRPETVPKPH